MDDLNKILPYVEVDPNTGYILNALDKSEVSSDDKYTATKLINKLKTNKIDLLKKGKWELEKQKNDVTKSIEDLSEQIKLRENQQSSFPKYVTLARDAVNVELKKMNIDVKVRIFAELVEEISEPEWRDALETYLGNKRFDLIIDGAYVEEALEIFHKLKLKKPNLVLTDKLEETQVDGNSAANLLVIPNIFARRYADYLLGKLYLCNSICELHNHPLGGIMKDGTLAKSYTVRNMEIIILVKRLLNYN